MGRAKPGTRQTQLMQEIEQTWQHQPSLAELAAWIDAPWSSTRDALKALERDGRVVVLNRGRNHIDGSPLRIQPRRPVQ